MYGCQVSRCVSKRGGRGRGPCIGAEGGVCVGGLCGGAEAERRRVECMCVGEGAEAEGWRAVCVCGGGGRGRGAECRMCVGGGSRGRGVEGGLCGWGGGQRHSDATLTVWFSMSY